MTREAVVVRARGLATRRLAAVLAPPATVEAVLRERTTAELAILRRWDPEAVAILELDEDRRTLRTIARGVVAGVAAARRTLGAVPTSTLPGEVIARLAEAAALSEVRAALDGHPLAGAFLEAELFDVERELARRFAGCAPAADHAMQTYLAQVTDIDNAQAALALASRGGDLVAGPLFLEGGRRIDRETFTTIASSRDHARTRLATAFAATPLAQAWFSATPSAIEDAALAWQLATQRQLRRFEPLGLASVIWLVLQRRDEARRLRAAAWNALLGGAA